MLLFVAGGKPENPKKNPRSKAKTNSKLSWLGGWRSHYSSISAPLPGLPYKNSDMVHFHLDYNDSHRSGVWPHGKKVKARVGSYTRMKCSYLILTCCSEIPRPALPLKSWRWLLPVNGNNKHIVNKFNSNTYCVHLYCLLYFKQRVQKKAGIC